MYPTVQPVPPSSETHDVCALESVPYSIIFCWKMNQRSHRLFLRFLPQSARNKMASNPIRSECIIILKNWSSHPPFKIIMTTVSTTMQWNHHLQSAHIGSCVMPFRWQLLRHLFSPQSAFLVTCLYPAIPLHLFHKIAQLVRITPA